MGNTFIEFNHLLIKNPKTNGCEGCIYRQHPMLCCDPLQSERSCDGIIFKDLGLVCSDGTLVEKHTGRYPAIYQTMFGAWIASVTTKKGVYIVRGDSLEDVVKRWNEQEALDGTNIR